MQQSTDMNTHYKILKTKIQQIYNALPVVSIFPERDSNPGPHLSVLVCKMKSLRKKFKPFLESYVYNYFLLSYLGKPPKKLFFFSGQATKRGREGRACPLKKEEIF